MKPTKSGSSNITRSSRVLSVLSAAVLFTSTGCYTKLATNDGDHWGYTGPVKQKVVVRETDDTIVVRETRVIHQPQPVVTDTVTYSNTSTGEENVVVNNYYAPAPATFGAYDPWTNSYPTWYDDYWYCPRAAVVISVGDPYYQPRWFGHHWRRHSYYQSYWNYNYYSPWDNWYHASYRGPGWAYYDPYYPYPPMYGYGYGCYAPVYDPFGYWPYYGYGYGYGGYGGYYDGYYGNGHHGYYGDNDDRDRDGRERKRGNVDGEERGRGGVAGDRGNGARTNIAKPVDGVDRVNVTDRGNAVPTRRTDVTVGQPVSTDGASRNVNTTPVRATSTRVGTVDISTGEIPTDLSVTRTFGDDDAREVKTSPSQAAPNVYNGNSTRTSTTTNTNTSRANDSRPVDRVQVDRTSSTPVSTGTRTTTTTPTNVVKSEPANTTRTTTTNSTPRSNSSSTPSSVSSTPRSSTTTQAPSYTPRSSSNSGAGSSSSVSNSGSRSSNSGSSSSGSSRGSDSRGSDTRSGNTDGGGRGRR